MMIFSNMTCSCSQNVRFYNNFPFRGQTKLLEKYCKIKAKKKERDFFCNVRIVLIQGAIYDFVSCVKIKDLKGY